LGETSNASVGDASRTQGYWGLAFDVGGQHVSYDGFTLGFGVGLMYLKMANDALVSPRGLFQIGWSW
jgi:hypothetical protein